MSDLKDLSLLAMFREELANQAAAIERDLLAFEQSPGDAALVDSLMRASHSIKGAARVVNIDPVVKLAHAMEDAFTQGRTALLDPMFAAVDLFKRCAAMRDEALQAWSAEDVQCAALAEAVRDQKQAEPETSETKTVAAPVDGETSLRVTADTLTAMIELGGQVTVDAAQMDAWGDDAMRLRARFDEIVDQWSCWESELSQGRIPVDLSAMRRSLHDYRATLRRSLHDFARASRRLSSVSTRLYNELGAIRMRPFAEGVAGLPRMVRDLARKLDKKVELRIEGGATRVDRDILSQLEAPLTHLVRNAVDHGLESPNARLAAGKPETGVVKLSAMHRGGRLHITVRDDGCGFNIERLRMKVVERGFNESSTAASLSEDELLEFLFLPGFSTASEVTEISGRGVGLDVVKTMVQQVDGHLRVENDNGAAFHFDLPVTLSLVRMLLFEAGGDVWALPLSKVERVLTADETVDAAVVLSAGDLLDLPSSPAGARLLLCSGKSDVVLEVERTLGESKMVVRELDERFRRYRLVSAWTTREDNAPVLVLDASELLRQAVQGAGDTLETFDVLVTDDSPTVRRMLAGMLTESGYSVREAEDGQAAWSLLQGAACRLLVTDLDMPQMNGLDLVKRLKADSRLADTPVIMVSYRDGAEDRMDAIAAGVDYYLDKGGFDREMFLLAVRDLMGDNA